MTEESGWVLECGTPPKYICGRKDKIVTKNPDEALRFARKQDAQVIATWFQVQAAKLGLVWRTTQHLWIDGKRETPN
jgi:hypothetical protein